MLIACHIGYSSSQCEEAVKSMLDSLRAGGAEVYAADCTADLREGTDMLLSVGGDGTFLCCVQIVADSLIPIAGVNTGHLGFLSENKPEDVAPLLLEGKYSIESRDLLRVDMNPLPDGGFWPYAFNEAGFRISKAVMMGVDVTVGDSSLPTYWGDGLLVSTSSGSTAYSLSVGGPICLPEVDAHIIAPIAPHNFNLRPLIVPSSVPITLKCRPRSGEAVVFMDNRSYHVTEGTVLHLSSSPFKVRKVVFDKSSFITALRTKLFWGEDRRNER